MRATPVLDLRPGDLRRTVDRLEALPDAPGLGPAGPLPPPTTTIPAPTRPSGRPGLPPSAETDPAWALVRSRPGGRGRPAGHARRASVVARLGLDRPGRRGAGAALAALDGRGLRRPSARPGGGDPATPRPSPAPGCSTAWGSGPSPRSRPSGWSNGSPRPTRPPAASSSADGWGPRRRASAGRSPRAGAASRWWSTPPGSTPTSAATSTAAGDPERLALVQQAYALARRTPWAPGAEEARDPGPGDPRVKILTAEVQSRCGGRVRRPRRLAPRGAADPRQRPAPPDRGPAPGRARLPGAVRPGGRRVLAHREPRGLGRAGGPGPLRRAGDRRGPGRLGRRPASPARRPAARRPGRPRPSPPRRPRIRPSRPGPPLGREPRRAAGATRPPTLDAWDAWARAVDERVRLRRLLDEVLSAHRGRVDREEPPAGGRCSTPWPSSPPGRATS